MDIITVSYRSFALSFPLLSLSTSLLSLALSFLLSSSFSAEEMGWLCGEGNLGQTPGRLLCGWAWQGLSPGLSLALVKGPREKSHSTECHEI